MISTNAERALSARASSGVEASELDVVIESLWFLQQQSNVFPSFYIGRRWPFWLKRPVVEVSEHSLTVNEMIWRLRLMMMMMI